MDQEIESRLKAAQALAKAHRMNDAWRLLEELTRRHPNESRAWHALSQIQFKGGAIKAALSSAVKAVEVGSRQLPYLVQLGRCRAAAGDQPGALEIVGEIERLRPSRAEDFDALGAICSLCADQERAQRHFARAVALQPKNPYYLHNLSTVQRFLGNFAAAEESCNKAIALNPSDYRAYYVRADLRRQTKVQNHIDEMTAILDAGISDWRGEVCIRYALAKEYEDIEEYARSFAMVKTAADLQRANMQYDVASDIAVIEQIIALHDKDWLVEAGRGCLSQEPVFIVGLPRTGTTLVERILGAHSEVHAAGELNNFAIEMTRAANAANGTRNALSRNQLVEATCTLDFAELGRAYINSTRPHTGRTSKFVDKMPQNYLYCGLIAAALPQARIICLKRSPMDACYAMYKAMFTGAYPFSYDLSDLGRYYVAFSRLVKHWQAVLGDRFLVVEYESLVQNLEREAQRVLSFCRLEWQSACLDFHLNSSPSTTASAVQVRSPIYKSSVGKWKRFRRDLHDLEQYLMRNMDGQ